MEGSNFEVGQVEYWIAKYIGSLGKRDPETFEFIQQISGISLLTEALLELRNPSESIAQAKTLVAFLDGPLLMNHLGLSGKRAKENTSYIVEKLRQAGATIACFRHSCDEVKDKRDGNALSAPVTVMKPVVIVLAGRCFPRRGTMHHGPLGAHFVLEWWSFGAPDAIRT